MKRTKSAIKEELSKDFVDAIPLAPQKPRRRKPSFPRTKEGGIDWERFLPVILTARPDGMPFDVYKQLLKLQQRKIKIGRRV